MAAEGEGEGERLNEGRSIEVEGDQQLLPVPELETVLVASASLQFAEKTAEGPHLVVGGAVLKNSTPLPVVLDKADLESNQG